VKTFRSDPVNTRSRCLEFRSITKIRPELVVQTLAAINFLQWRFSVGGGLSANENFYADGSLFDGGSPCIGGSTVGCILGLVLELPLVRKGVVELQSVVGDSNVAISFVRALVDSEIL